MTNLFPYQECVKTKRGDVLIKRDKDAIFTRTDSYEIREMFDHNGKYNFFNRIKFWREECLKDYLLACNS